jgi:cysteine sulfinate desulfinase/cysteine desulfurase-like protein
MLTPVSDSPFAVLTLIAAPAVFTNASSVLSLGNRLARVVDRTRTLVKDLHGAEIDPATRTLWVSHLARLENEDRCWAAR